MSAEHDLSAKDKIPVHLELEEIVHNDNLPIGMFDYYYGELWHVQGWKIGSATPIPIINPKEGAASLTEAEFNKYFPEIED